MGTGGADGDGHGCRRLLWGPMVLDVAVPDAMEEVGAVEECILVLWSPLPSVSSSSSERSAASSSSAASSASVISERSAWGGAKTRSI